MMNAPARPRTSRSTHHASVALAGAFIVAACSATPVTEVPQEKIGVTEAALTIGSLFGTGVDGTGAVLPDGSVDPHYKLTISGDLAFPGPNTYVVNSTVYPLNGSWVGDSSTSKWISVQAGNSATAAATSYSYTTTFSLTGTSDPTTASITGKWACDNSCLITLNGIVVPQTSPGFTAMTAFTIPVGSNFVTGTNALTFVVTNSPSTGTNPTGLRVDAIAGTAGCGQDAECATGQWCNNVTSTPGVCEATVPNGTAVPGGNCNATAGLALGTVGLRACTTGACDTSDSKCGYANSDGPCVTGAVCRSSVCDTALGGGTGRCEQCTPTSTANCTPSAPICDSSTFTCTTCNGDMGTAATAACATAAPYCPGGGAACTTCGTAGATATCTAAGATHAGGVCEASGACGSACVVDSNCTGTQWCDGGACVARLINGTPIPTVTGHSPTLNGACTAAAGSAVCASGVCDVKNNACGYENGDGPCTVSDPSVCQSGVCSTNGTCRAALGCNVDSDCAAKEYCDTATNTCLAQGVTGLPIPGGGACPTGTSDRCLSGVCGSDGVCGEPNGRGPCTSADASGTSGVCRSGLCDTAANGGNGVCEQCTAANGTACSGATPICDALLDTCVACNGDNGTVSTAPCGATTPYCPGNGGACATCGTAGGTTTCTSAGAVHAGGVCEASGACGSACVQDINCLATQWCNTGATPTPVCVARLANGATLPTEPNHDPALNGTCSASVGAAVCASGVCDQTLCGYANGDGPCTVATQGVCQSGVCSTNGKCRAATGCNVDTDCATQQYCDTASNTCQAQGANGVAIPGAGTCASGLSDRCLSGVCGADNICGEPNGSGPCTTLNAAGASGLCRSNVCDPTGNLGLGICRQCTPINASNCGGSTPICSTATETCVACNGDNGTSGTADCPATAPYCPGNGGACTTCGTVGGTTTCTAAGATHAGGVCEATGACGSTCVQDSNCAATQWCDTGALPNPTCVAQLINGTPIPIVGGHTPTLNGVCTVDVGKSVCASKVCDTGNNACGLANGGSCTVGGAAVCQSGACSTDGTCRPLAGCNVDADCASKQYCDTTTHLCLAQGATGLPIPGAGTCTAGASDRCLSGVCAADNICGDPNGVGPCTTANAAGTSGICRSGTCDPKDLKCGLANGDGTCTALDGPTVCRSMICAITGPNSGDCEQCTTDLQCVGTTNTPVCNLTTNTCTASGATDGGTGDGGTIGAGDAGSGDGGTIGTGDAGSGDGGTIGTGDAGSGDGGTIGTGDAGENDGGLSDASLSDSGKPDGSTSNGDGGNETPDAQANEDGASGNDAASGDDGGGNADSGPNQGDDSGIALDDGGGQATTGAGGGIQGGGCTCTTSGRRDSGSEGAPLFALLAVGALVQRRRRTAVQRSAGSTVRG